MPRSEKTLQPEQFAEVETLAAVLTVEQMADYFGIGRTTFFSIMDRQPEVAERYKKGKARAIGSIAGSLLSKARAGDTTSMIFFLKTQGGWREKTAIEHTGPDGKALPATSARQTLIQIIDRYAERREAAEGVESDAIENEDAVTREQVSR